MNFISLFFSIFNVPLIFIEPGTIGVFLAIALVFVIAGSAFFAFVMLRKTVKMAFRLLIIGVILLIAIVGSASFWWFSSSNGGDSSKPRPTNSRSR